MIPDAALLDRLRRSRLLPLRARGTVGVGERPSASTGNGMDFADFRTYQPGDDLRHLDPHVSARLGANYIRRYVVERQLPIAIIIDGSRSMSAGEINRFDLGRQLAGVLGYVGLVGGDEVRFGIGRDGNLEWSPRQSGVNASAKGVRWLFDEHESYGTFEGCLLAASQSLPQPGLVIIISDFWDVSEAQLKALTARGQEVWAIHLPAPEELEPALLGEGQMRLVDSETGEDVELDLSPSAIENWRTLSQEWRADLRHRLAVVNGRYALVEPGKPLASVVLDDFRRAGLLR